jgi:hypothetical protein
MTDRDALARDRKIYWRCFDDMISRTKLLATLRAVRGGFGALIGPALPSASIIWDTFTAAIELVEKQ